MKKKSAPRRVALIVPEEPRRTSRRALADLWRGSSRFRASFFLNPMPNLALLTIAAYLPSDWEVSYFDESFGRVDVDGGYDLVAITSLTCQAPRAYRLAQAFRRRGAHVVLGGVHPTVLPAEGLRHADTVIAGEAEGLWPAFLRDYRRGAPGRLYRAGAGEHCSLKGTKVPRYDLVAHLSFAAVPLQVGRGCPLGCEYCSVAETQGVRYRRKGKARIGEEIDAILSLRSPVPPLLFFTDDNLYRQRRTLESLLGQLQPRGVSWGAQMDAAVGARPELLDRLARSGCRRLLVGFENLHGEGTGGRRRRRDSRLDADGYLRMVEAIGAAGIEVVGMFMIGFDEDREDVFARLGEFIRAAGLRDAQVSICTPLPGSKLYRRLKRAGRLLADAPWSYHDFFHLLFRHPHLSARQLTAGQSRLYRRIFEP